MDYETLETLKVNHRAWKLLRADNAALIISFLHRRFIQPNKRTLPESELISLLEDYLFHLRREAGPEKFPREARAYLEDWASDKHGWLRKYYTNESDEPSFDIMPATEQAITWISSLTERPFIGTESRLLTIFDLLRQLVEGTETDPEARIDELERRRDKLDEEIARIKDGLLPLLNATAVRERFLQIAEVAQSLLSDFRAVEQNFRQLDRAARERIATWEGGKGELLDEILGERDAIADSDQGRSFRGFWDFLMSPDRQEELTALLARIFALEAVQELKPDRRIQRVHYDWLAAGEVTQRTVAQLSGELRRYLDDKAWLENRRIMEILHEIELKAVECRDEPPQDHFIELDDLSPRIKLNMDRPLFSPPLNPDIDDDVSLGDGDGIPDDALFNLVYVDKKRLDQHIRRALQRHDQISLQEVIETNPLEQGLAELVAYLSIASSDDGTVIDDEQKQKIDWMDGAGNRRQATLPLVIFGKAANGRAAGAKEIDNDNNAD